jgi:hypothetical protein
MPLHKQAEDTNAVSTCLIIESGNAGGIEGFGLIRRDSSALRKPRPVLAIPALRRPDRGLSICADSPLFSPSGCAPAAPRVRFPAGFHRAVL